MQVEEDEHFLTTRQEAKDKIAVQRLREAARLGFTTAVVPRLRRGNRIPGLQLVEVDTLRDALEALGLTGR